ncbi:hypothetical protein [Actinomyces sp.]
MSDTLEITREKWQHWIDTLAGGDDSIAARLEAAARDIQKIIDMQTSAKWGTTEPGLKAFQRAYTSYWREEQQALISMSQNAAAFAKQVEKALELLDTNEEEAVEFLNQAARSMPAGPALKGIGQFLPSRH